MRAVLLREVGAIEVADVEEPEPGPSEVIVEVAVAGICGSDVHAARDGGLLRTPPIVMGHEFSGIAEGRRVAVNPMISCGACDLCLRDEPHLCRTRSIVGIQRQGGLATRVAVPTSCLVDLPDHVSTTSGAMVEPLAVAHHAVELGRLEADDRVGVLGAGTIGLLVAYLCTGRGVDVSIADPNHDRLLLAQDLGATSSSVALEGEFDVVFDAVGNAASHRLSLEHLRPGGTTVWVGNEHPDPAFDAQNLVRIEQRVVGSAAYTPDDFAAAADLVDDTLLALATIRPMEDAPAMMYELMEPRPGQPIKVLFQP